MCTRSKESIPRQLYDEEGKKCMRQVGKVEVPQEAFLAALKMAG